MDTALVARLCRVPCHRPCCMWYRVRRRDSDTQCISASQLSRLAGSCVWVIVVDGVRSVGRLNQSELATRELRVLNPWKRLDFLRCSSNITDTTILRADQRYGHTVRECGIRAILSHWLQLHTSNEQDCRTSILLWTSSYVLPFIWRS